MSYLGTPAGMNFNDWITDTTGKSILGINNSPQGKTNPKYEQINKDWNKGLYDENAKLEDEANQKPDYALYFVLASIVFIIGSILGK